MSLFVRHSSCRQLTHLITVIVLLCFGLYVNAMTINQLEQQGGVKLNAWLSKGSEASKPSAVNEQVIMYIEVATPRWFTGGTRISAFGLPHLIVKQRNQFATNYTRKEAGQTWSYQRWEVTLYPQQSGEYSLPKVAVNLQVSAPDGNSVSGTLYTEPMSLFTYLPDGELTADQAWFAASDVNVVQKWSQSADKLKAGDTLTRSITVSAANTLSILLPPANKINDGLKGVKAYAKPAKLQDSQSRGNYQSERVDETVYLLQQGGDFTFPATTITWWDTESSQVKAVRLAQKTFHVTHTFTSLTRQYWPFMLLAALALMLSLSLVVAINRYYRTHPKPEWWQLCCQYRLHNWPQVRRLIYRKLRIRNQYVQLKQFEGSTQSDQRRWARYSYDVQHQTPTLAKTYWLWRKIKTVKTSNNKRILKGLERWEQDGDV